MSEGDVVKSLENVLTRLALTPEEQLGLVLWRLIPAVLRQLKHPGVNVRQKVLQLLSHVNKRIEGNRDIELPLVELTTVLVEADAEGNAAIRGLALFYIEKASAQSAPSARLESFPLLMKGIAGRPIVQRWKLLRSGMEALEGLPTEISHATPKKPKLDEEHKHLFAFLDDEADRDIFLEFALWMLLFQTRRREEMPLGVRNNSDDVPFLPEVAALLSSVPFGMSKMTANAVEGKEKLTHAKLTQRKLGLLKYLEASGQTFRLFVPILVASADPIEPVSTLAEEIRKKRFRIAMDSQDVDLEDSSLIDDLFDLFLGSKVERPEVVMNLAAMKIRLPASARLKSKLLNVFVRSIEAANRYPENREVLDRQKIRKCLRENGSMEFSVWMVKHMRLEKLFQVAPSILDELLELLNGGLTDTQRGYIYESIGQLAQREASVFHGRAEIAESLFKALETEAAGVHSQLQSAVSTLASAYKTSDPETENSIRELLFQSILSECSSVRLVAVTWSMRLYPFNDCFARFICIAGAADDRREVKMEALLGLNPVTLLRETSAGTASYPTISHFLSFLSSHKEWARIILARSSSVRAELVAFLRRCHAEEAEGEALESGEVKELLELHEDVLMKKPSTEDAVVTYEALVSLLSRHKEAVVQWSTKRLRDYLLPGLSNHSRAIRTPISKLVAVAVQNLDTDHASSLIKSLSPKIGPRSSVTYEAKCGVIQAYGYIGAAITNRTVIEALTVVTAAELTSMIQQSDVRLATIAALALSHQLLNSDFHDALKHHLEPSIEWEKWFKDTICASVFPHCRHKDLAVSSEAVTAVGLFAKSPALSVDLQRHCLRHLISLQNLKNEEVQFSIGEALSLGLSRNSIPSSLFLEGNTVSLRDAEIDWASLPEPVVPVTMHGEMLDELIASLTHSRPENRSSCCSHLLTIMTHCPKHPALPCRLERAQNAFLGLLGDKNELAQQTASKGVSLVYAIGDDSIKSRLLNGLTAVFKDPRKRGISVKVNSDTKIFAEGELGKIPGGGNLTTYKELCSLATDMGQPDLLYKFMDLANHQTAVTSRRGAAIGFAHIAEMASQDLKPYLDTMLPRIYRMQYDPNPAVQETMQKIWKSLVPDSKVAIDTHLDVIIEELLKEIGSRVWRQRQSSCRALADLLQGRPWTQLRGSFEQMWKMALRAADDIKESVRLTGMDLLRSLKRATIRFSDPRLSDTDCVAEAISLTLPALLDTISKSQVPGVLSIAMGTLCEVASSSSAQHLRPHLPTLVPALLDALSSLEPSVLDGMQMMVAPGIARDQIEALRVSAASQNPLHDVLYRCIRATDVSTLEQGTLTAKLKEMIQRGVGLSTRVGTVNFIRKLSLHLGSDIAPYASKFIKPLLTRSLSGDLSQTIIKAYASAIGSLCKFATEKTVAKLIDACMDAVREQEGKDMVIGLMIKELHSNASSTFSRHATAVVPYAFVKRFDAKESISAVWTQVLDDSIGTEAGAVRLYHQEIVEEAKGALAHAQWATRVAGANCIVRLYETDNVAMEQHSEDLLLTLIAQLKGRVWTGKEAVLKALTSVYTHSTQAVQQHRKTVVDTLKLASEKEEKEFKEAAVECLAKLEAPVDAVEPLPLKESEDEHEMETKT